MYGKVIADEDAKHLELEPGSSAMVSKLLLSDHNGTPVEYTEMLHVLEGMTITYNYIAGTPSPLDISMRHSTRYEK